MGRSRKGVTLDNMRNVLQYFNNSLERGNLYRKDKNGDIINCEYQELMKVSKAFNQMRAEIYEQKDREKYQKLLQQWIDTYILPEQWQRCLMTLRQKKSIKTLKLQVLNLPEDVYISVKMLSRHKGCTMSETIRYIIEPHIKKMYKNID